MSLSILDRNSHKKTMKQSRAAQLAQGARAPGLPPTEGLPRNRSYFFSLMVDAYETTT